MAGASILTFNKLSKAFNRAATYTGYAMDLAAPLLPRLGRAGATKEIQLNGLTVRDYLAIPEDAAFMQAWESLFDRAAGATTFQSPAWQMALLKTPEATRRLHLLCAYADETLIGILPLEDRRGVLRSAGTMLSDYLDPLLDPQRARQVLPTLLAAAKQLVPDHPIILENNRPETFGDTDLNTIAGAAGMTISERSETSVARIALPKSWDEYLAAMDSHERKELKRKINKAEQKGGGVLLAHREPQAVNEALQRVFGLIAGAGGGKARKAKWLFPPHFAIAAGPLATQGRLVVYELRVENRLAAGMIALPSKNGLVLWNTGFDYSMKPWSPGIVLFGMLIRQSIEQGISTVDLLRGQYDYKYRLGAKDHPLLTATFYHK
jgi:CelD/BcsL family acetyltransferase involved in cellulose biosynthesis